MSIESLKKQAKNVLRLLPGFVQANGSSLQLAQCQELVAQLHGYPSWFAAGQRLQATSPADVEPSLPEIHQANGKTSAPLPGTTMQVTMDGDDDKARNEMQAYLRRRIAHDARQARAREEGEPALRRLFDVAHGHSGQCRYVAAFLLGLYNGSRFPFDLTDFRAVDSEIVDDFERVLRMDAVARQEVHTYFANGGKRFEALAERWRIPDVRRLKLVVNQIRERGAGSFGGEAQLRAEIQHALESTWPAEEPSDAAQA